MLLRTSAVLGSALAVVLASACAAPTGEAVDEVGASALQTRAPIAFTPCSLVTGGSDTNAECANVDEPLDWDNPSGRRANFFIKRIRGTAPGPHKQLWLLQGGPGGAGDGFDSFAPYLADGNPAFDIYFPDHRGTGRSTFLDCPTAMAAGDMAACGRELVEIWGEGLKTFSSTTAARDLGDAIERTRTPGQEVHVYGVSYGTYWAQRYMQVFPTQATAVALDSVCQQGLCSVLKYGYWTDHVAKKFMAECAADAFCASKLGPDPLGKVREALAVVEAGTCAGTTGIPADAYREIFGRLAGSFQLRPLVPAAVHRILRCNEADVASLETLRNVVFGRGEQRDNAQPPQGLFSLALNFHIALSEMLEEPAVTRDELKTMLSDAVFTTYDRTLHDINDAWPHYARDSFVGRYPDTNVPVLVMNGTLDSQTPIEFADAIGPHYNRPGQSYVKFPRGTHGILFGNSPTTTGSSCGMTVWSQFVASPQSTIDSSCTAQIVKIDFQNAPQISGYFFGTPDMWDGAPAPTRMPSETDAAVATEFHRVMREGVPFGLSRR
jgi:pimeloyl-ACP methyl ester carboxylesterase